MGSLKGIIGGFIGIYGDYIRVAGLKQWGVGPKYDNLNGIWDLKP